MKRLPVVVALLALVFPFIPGVPPSWVELANNILLGALVAMGLVLLTGVGGMTSFAQAAFVGFGAYTTAVLTVTYGISPWLTLPASLLVTGLGALVIGAITVRLSGHYLPLGTLAWAVSVYYLFGSIPALGMHTGLTGIPPLSIGDFYFIDARPFYLLLWVVVVLVSIATLNLLNSRYGRAIGALRGGTVVAQSFGVKTARVKLFVFVYAALLAGLSGWLYAHFQRSVSPGPFGVNAGIEYLLMATIGGVGQIFGALLGSAIVTILREQMQFFLPQLLGQSGNFESIVFGILLVGMLQVSSAGMWPLLMQIWPFARRERSADKSLAESKAPELVRRTRPDRGTTLLELDRVRMQFGGLVALNGVSFSVGAGEIVGLIGPNGAGKSTIFNVLSGILTPTSGDAVLAGESTTGRPPNFMSERGLARTFQHAHLIPGLSVLDNVAIGAHLRGTAGPISAMFRFNRREEQQLYREAWRQVEHVGLADRINDTADSLPLGQLRLVEIARAIALDPIILFLDEPAAGLRHGERIALADLLRRLRSEGVAILLVEHDMNFVNNLADRIVVLDFGTMIAQGRPSEIRSNPAVIKAYLGT